MARYDIGTMNIKDYRGKGYMLERWAYSSKLEAERALRQAIRFSAKYHRHEISRIFRDKIKSGEGKGKVVYIIGTRGTW